MSMRGSGDPDSQIMEEFWGVELTKEKKTAVWDAEDEEEDGSLLISNNLEIRQACLGIDAKEGERNVVQVSVENDEGKTSSFTILSLRLGCTEQCTLFLNLQPPVTFKLIQGSGPVSIVGQITETMNNFLDSSDESDVEESPKASLPIPKKRPATSVLKRQAKMNKKDPETSIDTSLSKSATDNIDDDDDDDEEALDDDMEDDDDDDDEDDESYEEEEVKEVKPVPKKTQINGGRSRVKGDKVMAGYTPQKKSATKVVTSLPSKTLSDKKKRPTTEGLDIKQIKESLLKMSVPKKLSKFNNFVSNSFKVKDDDVKKQLWEHVQKNRPQK